MNQISPYTLFSQITKNGMKVNELFSYNNLNNILLDTSFSTYEKVLGFELFVKLHTINGKKIKESITEKTPLDEIIGIYQCLYIGKREHNYYIGQTIQDLSKRMNSEHTKLNSKEVILEFRFPNDYNLTSIETIFIHLFENYSGLLIDNGDKKSGIKKKIESPYFFHFSDTSIRHENLVYIILKAIELKLGNITKINFSGFDCFHFNGKDCSINMNVFCEDDQFVTCVRKGSIISHDIPGPTSGYAKEYIEKLLKQGILKIVGQGSKGQTLYCLLEDIHEKNSFNYLSSFLDRLTGSTDGVGVDRLKCKLKDGTLINHADSYFAIRKNETRKSKRQEYQS